MTRRPTSNLIICRCREWYNKGKELATYNDTKLHVTSPYQDANSDKIIQGATSPLIDPSTNEYVGQVLIDFNVIEGFNLLKEDKTSFPILITVGEEKYDAVIAQNFSLLNQTLQPIGNVLLGENSSQSDLNRIIQSMKSGESNRGNYTKMNEYSSSTETVHLVYKPIVIQNPHSIDSSNFSRGVNVTNITVYSLAYAGYESKFLQPFQQMRKHINEQLSLSVYILAFVIVGAAIIAIYVSYRVTASITDSLLYLRDLMKSMKL